MKITFLGTVGWYPIDNFETSCVLVEGLNGTPIVLDAGTGLYRLPQHTQADEINILLSHYHYDHAIGLTWLGGLLKSKKVNIYGSKVKDNLSKLFSHPLFSAKLSDFPLSAKLKEIGEETFRIGKAKITSKYVPHTDLVLAYRIESKGKILCYVTDTQVNENEIDFIKNANLLIHECYYPTAYRERAEIEGHSVTIDVAKIAKKANVKKLALFHICPFLTHLSNTYEQEAQEVFPNSFLAKDLMKVEI